MLISILHVWANENWSKRWDGGNQEIIAEQDYGTEDDWKKHLLYMVQFFKDERYITLNGDPVFLIYKPEEIPDLHRMVTYWQSEIKKFGFNRICLMIQNSDGIFHRLIMIEISIIKLNLSLTSQNSMRKRI